MAINTVSRKLRVLIGTDEQDWSASVGVFQPGRASLGEEGFLPITASLEILATPSNPESIDPAENPTRWHPGQPVLIQVPNQAGAWVDHPQGRLFILEEPDLPEEQGGIVLQLGCRLAWHDTFEFDDDQTGVTVGTATNCATVAQNLLEANEIPTSSISLSTWPYALAIPEGKGINGSFVQQAGGIAYSNDWRYLWQQPNGLITDDELDLSITAPLITITLGSNDLLYRRVKVEGTPPDRLKVAAVGVTVTSGQNPSVTVEETYGAPDGNTADEPIVLKRTTTSISWDANNEYIQTLDESNFRYYVFDAGTLNQLVPNRELTEHREYNESGRLLKKTTTERRTIITGFVPELTWVWYDKSVLTETYTVGADEVLQQIEAKKDRAIISTGASIVGGQIVVNVTSRLVRVEDVKTSWQKLTTNTWKRVVSLTKYLFLGGSETGSRALEPETTVTVSSTGSTHPPKVEFFDEGISVEEVEHQATINYTLPGGGTGRTRKALITLPHGFSQTQCETIAQRHIALMAGRHRAALIEFPITDALLTAPPLFPCNVVMPSGEVRHYRIDGLSWEHTQDQAKAVATGILVGTTPAPTEANPNPTPIPTVPA